MNRKKVIKGIKKDIESYLFINDISIKKRSREITDARKLFCYVCYYFFKDNYKDITEELNLNHDTFIYHKNTYKEMLKFNFAPHKELAELLIKKYNSLNEIININVVKSRGGQKININNVEVSNHKKDIEKTLINIFNYLGYNHINIIVKYEEM